MTSLLPFDTYRGGEQVRELERAGDSIQMSAVNAANAAVGREFAHFVGGVKERFAGHEPDPNLLGFNLHSWLHEALVGLPAEWYHPNIHGHAAYAELLLEDPRFSLPALQR